MRSDAVVGAGGGSGAAGASGAVLAGRAVRFGVAVSDDVGAAAATVVGGVAGAAGADAADRDADSTGDGEQQVRR